MQKALTSLGVVRILCLLCLCLYQCRCRCLCLCLCMLIWERRKRQKKERKWWKKRRKINKQQQQRLKQFHNIRCIHLRWCLFFISFIRICWYARAAFFYFITHARMYIFTYTFFFFCSVQWVWELIVCLLLRYVVHIGEHLYIWAHVKHKMDLNDHRRMVLYCAVIAKDGPYVHFNSNRTFCFHI